MKSNFVKLTAVCAVALLAACGYSGVTAEEVAPAPAPPSKQAVALATADNKFGLDLFKKLHKDGENTFISPTSIALAMQMARQGAAGDTRDEMDDAMGLGNLDVAAANKDLLAELAGRKGVKLSIANSLWADPGRVTMKETYVNDVQTYFDSEARTVDFADPATVNAINDWISGKTNKLIPKMLDEIPGDALAYLINAIYFKGEWSVKFNKAETRDADFHLADGSKKTVKLMSRNGEMLLGKDESARFAKLTYGEDEQAAMWIALPEEGTTLDTLVKKLDAQKLKLWAEEAHMREGRLKLPRFKLRYAQTLNDSLKAVGVKKAFDESGADFAPMGSSPLGSLYISRVLHEAVVIVNEEGTEAAAAAIVEMKPTSAPADPFSMICDRPFLFVITDEPTGAILFIGTCYNPESK